MHHIFKKKLTIVIVFLAFASILVVDSYLLMAVEMPEVKLIK